MFSRHLKNVLSRQFQEKIKMSLRCLALIGISNVIFASSRPELFLGNMQQIYRRATIPMSVAIQT